MNANKKKTHIKIDLRTYAIIGALLVLWILFAVLTSGMFFTVRNISNLFRQMSIVGILGVGALLVIVAGHIDLSVGYLTGFTGCISAVLMCYHGTSTFVAILVAVAVGVAFGCLQGLVVAFVNVPSFIVTLGGQMVLQGAVLALTKGVTITPLNESYLLFGQAYIPSTVSWIICILAIILSYVIGITNRANKKKYSFEVEPLGRNIAKRTLVAVIIAVFCWILTSYKGIPVPIFILFGVVLIFTFIAEKTTFGRKVYAIGGNIEAVRYSGINIKKNIVAVFIVNGIISAIAGVVLAARQGAGIASNGVGMELDAIAAAVIGGASMSGGVGKVYGAIIGALLMATIDNGMTMLNMQTYWQYMVKGGILVFAVAFDMLTKKSKS